MPPTWEALRRDTEAIGFALGSDPETGALLRALAASKPGGRLLELGTGTGLGTAWLLDGMDAGARLTTVDIDPEPVEVARRHLGADPRAEFLLEDAAAFLRAPDRPPYDLVFADAFPGKYQALDRALALLAPGGLYVVDDLLPKADWPEGEPLARDLVAKLESLPELAVVKLAWSTGLLVATRRGVDIMPASDV
jgi:predicted O-methyltransferase YrrM